MTPAIEERGGRAWLGRLGLVVMSSLLALLAGELALRVGVAWRPTAGLEALRSGAEFVAPEGRAEGVPASYRAMVGVGGYRAAMTRIDDLRRQFGFERIVFGYLDTGDDTAGTDAADRGARDRQAREIARELGIPVVSAYDVTARFLEEHGLDSPWRSELTVSAADAHPSAVWHEIFAEALLDHFESGGREKALAARAGRSSRAEPGSR